MYPPPYAIIHSQNTCYISKLEAYYLIFIASQLYIRKSGCSVLRLYNWPPYKSLVKSFRRLVSSKASVTVPQGQFLRDSSSGTVPQGQFLRDSSSGRVVIVSQACYRRWVPNIESLPVWDTVRLAELIYDLIFEPFYAGTVQKLVTNQYLPLWEAQHAPSANSW